MQNTQINTEKIQNESNSIVYQGVKIGFDATLESMITQEMLDYIIEGMEVQHSRAAAQPVTAVKILGVASTTTQGRWEEIKRGQLSTNIDHDGNIYVATATYGYTASRYGKYNSHVMPNYQTDIKDNDIYIDHFDLSGTQEAGQFVIEAMGISARLYQDSIMIV
ncbi:hypothetical protein CCZ01_09740 [Helicobacter monodelphidis]|uniref:DUF4879 domain-containing protein n=1 Tax=Helicobacter sp. 15-1451 TaxID=2004995 RepID=UPI000DCDB380|nr:DUF4879 domain-containing protein [Helicobacter sp. 15-1451]RAX56224.1 hypothetical protein CCZ01_09740 [Helicobacter sp. 15-1451]